MEATSATISPQGLASQRSGFPTTLGSRRILRTRRVLLFLPWLGLAWQGVLAQTPTDWLSAFLAASGAFLVFFDAFRPKRLYRYPLSTLVLLGFGVTLQLGPLLFTAIEGNSITVNLLVPVATFGHGVLASLVCLLAHTIYRQAPWLRFLRAGAQRVLLQLKLFQPLRIAEVVAMGLFGVFALASGSWFSGLAVASPVLVKFIGGFQFFSIIPAAFLLQTLGSQVPASASPPSRKPLVLFLLFMALIVLVSLGRNARAPFVAPVACLFLGLALQWLYGLIRLRLGAVLAVGLAIVVLLPLARDMATAMVMVRTQRGNASPAELLDLTITQFQDRQAVTRYRLATAEVGLTSDWSENYVSNLFLARFANAKFPDNSLENAARLSPSQRNEMAAFQWWRLLVILPGPVLTLLGMPEETKKELTFFSFGDKLYELASGSQYALGGFRTGHFFGTGMAGFGFGYLGILLLGLLLVFPLVDAHSLVAACGSNTTSPLLSAVAITQLIGWFTFSNSESVTALLAFPLRGFFEPVLLFALILWLLARVRVA
jgi:hypothetical protein